MNADFEIGGGWGHHVDWWVDDWGKVDFNKDTLSVYGHALIRPKKGQTLMGEFNKSWIKFEFVDVTYCHDPDDMFFAKVKAIEQELKE